MDRGDGTSLVVHRTSGVVAIQTTRRCLAAADREVRLEYLLAQVHVFSGVKPLADGAVKKS